MYMLRKYISYILVFVFFVTSTGIQKCFSATVNTFNPILKSDILLGVETGRITSASFKKASKKVILIKDLHCNAEVQNNTYKILGAVSDKYPKKLRNIYVEGAWKDLDMRLVRALPELYGVKEEFTDKLIEKGLMTGAEKYAVFNKNIKLKGLEDEQLYKQDFRFLVDSYELRDKSNFFIQLALSKLNVYKKKIYSDEMKNLEKLVVLYQNEKISMAEYLHDLNEYCEKFTINFKEKAPELYKLYLSTLLKRKILKFKYVEEDANFFESEIIDFLTKQEYKKLAMLKKNGATDYYFYLQQLSFAKNIPFDRFKALSRYLDYLDMYSSVDTGRILANEDVLIHEILMAASTDIEQRQLIEIETYLQSYYRFLNNFAIDVEVIDIMVNGQIYLSKIRDYLNKNSNDLVWMNGLKKTYQDFQDMVKIMRDFYVYADKRNYAFVENLIKASDEVVVAVLGGFHADVVSRLLIEAGYECLVISPNITKQADNILYERLVKEQAKVLGVGFQDRLALISLFQFEGMDTEELKNRAELLMELLETDQRNKIVDRLKKAYGIDADNFKEVFFSEDVKARSQDLMLAIFDIAFENANLTLEQQIVFYEEMQEILPDIKLTEKVDIKIKQQKLEEGELDAIATELLASDSPTVNEEEIDNAQILFEYGRGYVEVEGTATFGWLKPKYEDAYNFVKNRLTYEQTMETKTQLAYRILSKQEYTEGDLQLVRNMLSKSEDALHKAAYIVVLKYFLEDKGEEFIDEELLLILNYLERNKDKVDADLLREARVVKLSEDLEDDNYIITDQDVEIVKEKASAEEADAEEADAEEGSKIRICNQSLVNRLNSQTTPLTSAQMDFLRKQDKSRYVEKAAERIKEKFEDEKAKVDDLDMEDAILIRDEEEASEATNLVINAITKELLANVAEGTDLDQKKLQFLKGMVDYYEIAITADADDDFLRLDTGLKFADDFADKIYKMCLQNYANVLMARLKRKFLDVEEDVEFEDQDVEDLQYLADNSWDMSTADYDYVDEMGRPLSIINRLAFFWLKQQQLEIFDEEAYFDLSPFAVLEAKRVVPYLQTEPILLDREQELYDFARAVQILDFVKKEKDADTWGPDQDLKQEEYVQFALDCQDNQSPIIQEAVAKVNSQFLDENDSVDLDAMKLFLIDKKVEEEEDLIYDDYEFLKKQSKVDDFTQDMDVLNFIEYDMISRFKKNEQTEDEDITAIEDILEDKFINEKSTTVELEDIRMFKFWYDKSEEDIVTQFDVYSKILNIIKTNLKAGKFTEVENEFLMMMKLLDSSVYSQLIALKWEYVDENLTEEDLEFVQTFFLYAAAAIRIFKELRGKDIGEFSQFELKKYKYLQEYLEENYLKDDFKDLELLRGLIDFDFYGNDAFKVRYLELSIKRLETASSITDADLLDLKMIMASEKNLLGRQALLNNILEKFSITEEALKFLRSAKSYLNLESKRKYKNIVSNYLKERFSEPTVPTQEDFLNAEQIKEYNPSLYNQIVFSVGANLAKDEARLDELNKAKTATDEEKNFVSQQRAKQNKEEANLVTADKWLKYLFRTLVFLGVVALAGVLPLIVIAPIVGFFIFYGIYNSILDRNDRSVVAGIAIGVVGGGLLLSFFVPMASVILVSVIGFLAVVYAMVYIYGKIVEKRIEKLVTDDRIYAKPTNYERMELQMMDKSVGVFEKEISNKIEYLYDFEVYVTEFGNVNNLLEKATIIRQFGFNTSTEEWVYVDLQNAYSAASEFILTNELSSEIVQFFQEEVRILGVTDNYIGMLQKIIDIENFVERAAFLDKIEVDIDTEIERLIYALKTIKKFENNPQAYVSIQDREYVRNMKNLTLEGYHQQAFAEITARIVLNKFSESGNGLAFEYTAEDASYYDILTSPDPDMQGIVEANPLIELAVKILKAVRLKDKFSSEEPIKITADDLEDAGVFKDSDMSFLKDVYKLVVDRIKGSNWNFEIVASLETYQIPDIFRNFLEEAGIYQDINDTDNLRIYEDIAKFELESKVIIQWYGGMSEQDALNVLSLSSIPQTAAQKALEILEEPPPVYEEAPPPYEESPPPSFEEFLESSEAQNLMNEGRIPPRPSALSLADVSAVEELPLDEIRIDPLLTGMQKLEAEAQARSLDDDIKRDEKIWKEVVKANKVGIGLSVVFNSLENIINTNIIQYKDSQGENIKADISAKSLLLGHNGKIVFELPKGDTEIFDKVFANQTVIKEIKPRTLTLKSFLYGLVAALLTFALAVHISGIVLAGTLNPLAWIICGAVTFVIGLLMTIGPVRSFLVRKILWNIGFRKTYEYTMDVAFVFEGEQLSGQYEIVYKPATSKEKGILEINLKDTGATVTAFGGKKYENILTMPASQIVEVGTLQRRVERLREYQPITEDTISIVLGVEVSVASVVEEDVEEVTEELASIDEEVSESPVAVEKEPSAPPLPKSEAVFNKLQELNIINNNGEVLREFTSLNDYDDIKSLINDEDIFVNLNKFLLQKRLEFYLFNIVKQYDPRMGRFVEGGGVLPDADTRVGVKDVAKGVTVASDASVAEFGLVPYKFVADLTTEERAGIPVVLQSEKIIIDNLRQRLPKETLEEEIQIKILGRDDIATGLVKHEGVWYLTKRDLQIMQMLDYITDGKFFDRLIQHETGESKALSEILSKNPDMPIEKALEKAHRQIVAEMGAKTQTMDERLYTYVNRMLTVRDNRQGGAINFAAAAEIMQVMMQEGYKLEELFKADDVIKNILAERAFESTLSGGEFLLETEGKSFGEFEGKIPENLKGKTVVVRGGFADMVSEVPDEKNSLPANMLTLVKDARQRGGKLMFVMSGEQINALLEANKATTEELIGLNALSLSAFFTMSNSIVLSTGKMVGNEAYQYAQELYGQKMNSSNAAKLIDALIRAELKKIKEISVPVAFDAEISIIDKLVDYNEEQAKEVTLRQFIIAQQKIFVDVEEAGLDAPKIIVRDLGDKDATLSISFDGEKLSMQNAKEEPIDIQLPILLTIDDLTLAQKVVLQAAHASKDFAKTIAIASGPVLQGVILPFIAKIRKEKGLKADQAIDRADEETLKGLAAAA